MTFHRPKDEGEAYKSWAGPLLFRGKARDTDPETSHVAAHKVPAKLVRDRIVEALRSAGDSGLTSLEASGRIAPDGVDPTAYLQSVSPRFAELRDLGLAKVALDGLGKPRRRLKRQVWTNT